MARRTHRTASCHSPIAEAIDTNGTTIDVEATYDPCMERPKLSTPSLQE